MSAKLLRLFCSSSTSRFHQFFVVCLCALLQNCYAQGTLSLTASVINPTCDFNNGIVVTRVSGGKPPYSYYSSAAQVSNNTGVFPKLSEGSYDIHVVDSDGEEASVDLTLVSAYRHPYYLDVVVENPSGCLKQDGSITLNAGGGLAPYTFSLDNGQTFGANNKFQNLGPGAYNVFVKDANGCVGAPWSPIGGSYLNYQYYWIGLNAIEVENKNCATALSLGTSGPACGNLGFLDFYYQDTSVYQYSMDGITFKDITTGGVYFLEPGSYTIYYKNRAGLINSVSRNIPNNCEVIATVTNTACNAGAGQIVAHYNGGGIRPYRYSIDGKNFQADSVFKNLSKGYYTVIVKDKYGAMLYTEVLVDNNCPAVTAVAKDASCGKMDGTITASGTNGTPPYRYSVDGSNFQNSTQFVNLAAGTYTVTVKDATGNTNEATVTVATLCLTVAHTSEPAACNQPNGKIIIQVLQGKAPFGFAIDGKTPQVDSVFKAVLPGNHVILVTDANGASELLNVVVGNTPAPKIQAVSLPGGCLENTGSVTISQTGGAGGYSYSIDGKNYQASGQFAGLPVSLQTAYVKDLNNCIDSTVVEIKLINDLSVNAGGPFRLCEGTAIKINASSNGDSFAWTPAIGLDRSDILQPNFIGTTGAVYHIKAVRGICVLDDSVKVTVLAAPIANAGSDRTICAGSSTQLQGSGGSTFKWSPSLYLADPAISNPVVINPLATQAYQLQVIDANGCQSLVPDQVLVTVTPPGKLFAGNDTSVILNQTLSLFAVDVNNVGYNSFSWTPGVGLDDPLKQNPSATIKGDIIYTVTGRTPANCEAVGRVVIKAYTYSEIFVPSAFTPNGDHINDVLKAIPVGLKSFNYFRVVNRWGQPVFVTNNAGKGWDGKINGLKQQSDTYVWFAAGIGLDGNKIVRTGTVMLIN